MEVGLRAGAGLLVGWGADGGGRSCWRVDGSMGTTHPASFTPPPTPRRALG
jgi:hypothetical protein